MDFEPKFLATGIGSAPYLEAKKACQVVLENFHDIPFWPQLPKRDFKENMLVQYSEGLPCLVLKEDEREIFFETNKPILRETELFFSQYIDHNLDYFAISKEYATGFYEIIKQIKKQPNLPLFIKGQVTGPITFGLSVTDEEKIGIIHHELLGEAARKNLRMKAKWQEYIFKRELPGVRNIIFFDEPYLSSYGASSMGLSRNEIIAYLNDCLEAVEGLRGIHCCGNTDWSILLETETNILSFDAYNYAEAFIIYKEQIESFLSRGGVIAWGIVPASEDILNETTDKLIEKLENSLKTLTSKGIDKELMMKKSLITPSCGTGALSEDLALKIFSLTNEVSEKLRAKYFS